MPSAASPVRTRSLKFSYKLVLHSQSNKVFSEKEEAGGFFSFSSLSKCFVPFFVFLVGCKAVYHLYFFSFYSVNHPRLPCYVFHVVREPEFEVPARWH